MYKRWTLKSLLSKPRVVDRLRFYSQLSSFTFYSQPMMQIEMFVESLLNEISHSRLQIITEKTVITAAGLLSNLL